MKIFVLLDNENIVRCVASEEVNLHKDKLWMRKFCVERKGIVGDEYNPITGEWTKRPENYPQPSEEELRERMIQDEIHRLTREQAIQSLTDQGLLKKCHTTAE